MTLNAFGKNLNEAVGVGLQCKLSYQEGTSKERLVPLTMNGENIPFTLEVSTFRSNNKYNYFEYGTNVADSYAHIPTLGKFHFSIGVTQEFSNKPYPKYPHDYKNDIILATLANPDGSF